MIFKVSAYFPENINRVFFTLCTEYVLFAVENGPLGIRLFLVFGRIKLKLNLEEGLYQQY
jgi:hypothetical protein